jgi:hypothetical protein
MPTLEILNSYSLPELKKIIRATNITGYSKLKKAELVKLMLRPEHKSKFEGLMKRDKRVPDVMDSKRTKLNREFKKKAKKARDVFEFKEASKKIGEQLKKKKFPKKEEPKKEEPKKEEPKKERISNRPILTKEELKKIQEEKKAKAKLVAQKIRAKLVAQKIKEKREKRKKAGGKKVEGKIIDQ